MQQSSTAAARCSQDQRHDHDEQSACRLTVGSRDGAKHRLQEAARKWPRGAKTLGGQGRKVHAAHKHLYTDDRGARASRRAERRTHFPLRAAVPPMPPSSSCACGVCARTRSIGPRCRGESVSVAAGLRVCEARGGGGRFVRRKSTLPCAPSRRAHRRQRPCQRPRCGPSSLGRGTSARSATFWRLPALGERLGCALACPTVLLV